MQPSLIRSTAETSLDLLEMRGRGSPESLLLAWVAWEGLKMRLLVVGLAKRGWRVSDVSDVLSASRLHTQEDYRSLFAEVFGASPESTRGVGAQWRAIEDFRGVRNRYVHGTRGSAPAKLEAGTHLITGRVLDPSWLSGLAVSADGEPVKIGDPFRRLPSSQSSYESRTALTELVGLGRRR
jgi:hypothetical protein